MDALKEGGAGGMHGGMEDILGAFFGGGGRRRGPKKTKDIAQALPVTLEELFSGTLRKMKLTKNVGCKTCNSTGSSDGKSYVCKDCDGHGQVEVVRSMGFGMMRQAITCPSCRGAGEVIPAGKKCTKCDAKKFIKEDKILEVDIERGMKHEDQIMFRGESHEAPGHLPGDVIFVLQEKEHEVFRRKDAHLFIDKTIPLVNALTGFTFVLEHLDGRKLVISTPPNTVISPGLQLEIPQEGMPVRNFPSERGSLLIRFDVEFPKTLNPSQITGLLSALPGRIETSTPEGATEINLQEVDPNNLNKAYGSGKSAFDSSSEEEGGGGGGGPGVACAQQ